MKGKKVKHIEVNSNSSIDIKECFDMLIKSIIKDKAKEELIDLYGIKYKNDNFKNCLEKKKKREYSPDLINVFVSEII